MKLRLTIVALLVILSIINTSAQKDTVYFNENWEIISEKSEMHFFRIYEQKDGKLYLLKDYYRNGVLQMEGTVILDDDKYIKYASGGDYSKTGKFIYYQFNGKKSSEGVYKKDLKHGVWKNYYDTLGTLEMIRNYRYGELEGEAKEFYKTGELENVYSYYKGDIHGAHIGYYKNGMLSRTGNYKNGKKDGEHKIYYPSGVLKGTKEYDNDKLITGKKIYYPSGKLKLVSSVRDGRHTKSICYNEDGNTIPCKDAFKVKDTISVRFAYIDPYPYPDYDVYGYISKNLKYPKKAVDGKIEGRVFVNFVVDIDGAIINVKSLSKGVNKLLEKEAIRLVSSMPKWTPGEQDGVPIQVYYTLPIRFELDRDGENKKE